MVSIDLMVFDLDGTLINSGLDIANSVNHCLKSLDMDTLDTARIISYVGDGVQTLIERALGPENRHLAGRALEIFSSHYAGHMLDTTEPYPGIRDVLEGFGGKKKIVVTNKRQAFTDSIVQALGIAHYFEEIIGADRTPFRKPDERLLLPLLEKYRPHSDKTVVIGDGVNDVLLAKNCHVASCAFLNGLTDRKNLMALEPDLTYEDPRELLKMFS